MDKKSFLIYLDYEEQFNLLTDEQIGQLMRAIMEYEKTGNEPVLDGMLKMAFSFIKTQLDRDREKYNKKCEKNKQNGAKGGRPKKKQEDNKKPNGFNKSEGLKQKPKKADKEDEEDKEDDKDNEEELKKKNKKKKFQKPTVEEIQNYCYERKNNVNVQQFYNYYESNGWKVGKNPMKDWQATIRTWEQRNKSNTKKSVLEEWLNSG